MRHNLQVYLDHIPYLQEFCYKIVFKKVTTINIKTLKFKKIKSL